MTTSDQERGGRNLRRTNGRLFYADIELPDGPWHDEPDELDFEASGFACKLCRGPLGAWCGYVGIPAGHPWYGKYYDSPDVNAEVHGGLTWSNEHAGTTTRRDLWWLGFDCSHFLDLVPGMLGLDIFMRHRVDWPGWGGLARADVYRDLAYVRAETESLAKQAREASV
jgi:hypothetical protein